MNVEIPAWTHGILTEVVSGDCDMNITSGNTLAIAISMDANSSCQIAYSLQFPIVGFDLEQKRYRQLGLSQLTVRLLTSSDDIFISQCQIFDGETSVFEVLPIQLSSSGGWTNGAIYLPEWSNVFNFSMGIVLTIETGPGPEADHQMQISSVGADFYIPVEN